MIIYSLTIIITITLELFILELFKGIPYLFQSNYSFLNIKQVTVSKY